MELLPDERSTESSLPVNPNIISFAPDEKFYEIVTSHVLQALTSMLSRLL
jgi:hypothetical protein